MNQFPYSIIIEVKDGDILRCQRRHPLKCLISVLVREQYGFGYVSTGYDTVVATTQGGDPSVTYEHSTEVREMVFNFDHGMPVRPGFYVLTRKI